MLIDYDMQMNTACMWCENVGGKLLFDIKTNEARIFIILQTYTHTHIRPNISNATDKWLALSRIRHFFCVHNFFMDMLYFSHQLTIHSDISQTERIWTKMKKKNRFISHSAPDFLEDIIEKSTAFNVLCTKFMFKYHEHHCANETVTSYLLLFECIWQRNHYNRWKTFRIFARTFSVCTNQLHFFLESKSEF